MPELLRTVALFYDDDAYVEPRHDQGRLPGEDRPAGLMGRQVAGREFLKAYLGHGSWTELVALVRNQQSAESLKLEWREKAWSRQARRLRFVDERQFHDAFLRDPPATVLHLPCPPDSRYAWARRASAPNAFAMSGVTHTLCSLEAVRQICDYVTGPFEPFDALVCTSSVVVAMVRQVADAYAEYLRDRMGGRPALGLRLAQIPLGVDTDLFRPATRTERAKERHALGITDGEVAVLFVGRLSHHAKAHPFPMFEGLARAAHQTGQAVHLILCGWAASPAVHAAFVEGARLFAPGIRVTLVDGEDPEHRFSVWRAADLFTSLSDNIQETFGLVIVEAMACGLPVVASDWDGYRDLVIDGQTGLRVTTAMVKGATHQTTARLIMGEINYDHFLAECSQATVVDAAAAEVAFRHLLGDPERRREMGAAGRRRALERFNWSRIIAQYERLWSEQEELRREYQKHGGKQVTPGGPSLYPEPESSFQGYPTTWLDSADRLESDHAAAARLDTFLNTPLTHHDSKRRLDDRSILASILADAVKGCSIADLDRAFQQAGVDHRTGRATVAWLLKYGLLALTPDLERSIESKAERKSAETAFGEQPSFRAPASTRRICFVTVSMGRLSHLRQTLDRLTAQPGCSCVVVDYACPEGTGDWVAASYPSVGVVRAADRKEFHRSEARNLGAKAADAPWICFVDADVRIAANFAETIWPRLEAGAYCAADSFSEGTEGTFICSHDDFARAGGFDEALQGWGEEDNDLYDAFEFLGVQRATFPVALLHHLPHGEDERARFHSIKPDVSHAVNRVYRILKWDTAKLRGRLLTLPMRKDLYRTVSEVVATALAQDRPGDLNVRLPYGIVPGGWQLPRSLVYRLVRDRASSSPQAEASQSGSDTIGDDVARGDAESVSRDGAG